MRMNRLPSAESGAFLRRCLALLLGAGALCAQAATGGAEAATSAPIALPAPHLEGGMSLTEALRQRASGRDFASVPIDLGDVSQLLWAAQGVTHGEGKRTAPSAGALYPLRITFAALHVQSLAPGVYRFESGPHTLVLVRPAPRPEEFVAATHGQAWIGAASAVILISSADERTTGKYGSRGLEYIDMEAGHVAQNVLLQATALGLAATPVGAMNLGAVSKAMKLPAGERPLMLIPVGKPRMFVK